MSQGIYSPALSIATASALAAAFHLAFPTTSAYAAPQPRSVVYQQRHVHGVTAHVVTVNLNDPHIRVTVNLPQGGIGRSESMGSFVSRLQPVAAITGTFFDTRTLLPVGDIVTRGRKVYTGPAGTGFAIRPDNTVKLKHRSWGRSPDWSDYRTVLCTGPTLLSRGRNALYPRAEGYRDPSLFALRPRTAVGITKKNKMLMVAVNKPIHLSDMRHIMKLLGAVDAVGLDGGSSTALYADGRTVVKPGRRLTNLLAVYRTAEPSVHVAQRLKGIKTLVASRKAAPKAKKVVVVKRTVAPAQPAAPPHPLKAALKKSLVIASRTP